MSENTLTLLLGICLGFGACKCLLRPSKSRLLMGMVYYQTRVRQIASQIRKFAKGELPSARVLELAVEVINTALDQALSECDGHIRPRLLDVMRELSQENPRLDLHVFVSSRLELEVQAILKKSVGYNKQKADQAVSSLRKALKEITR